MPNLQAQCQTIVCVGAKRLVVRHRLALPTPNNCFEQVNIPLLEGCLPNRVELGACTNDCGRAYLRKTLQQESNLKRIDLYDSGAKVKDCRLIGGCHPWAVKVESEVSAANWRHKTRQTLPPHSPTTRPAFSLSN